MVRSWDSSAIGSAGLHLQEKSIECAGAALDDKTNSFAREVMVECSKSPAVYWPSPLHVREPIEKVKHHKLFQDFAFLGIGRKGLKMTIQNQTWDFERLRFRLTKYPFLWEIQLFEPFLLGDFDFERHEPQSLVNGPMLHCLQLMQVMMRW